MNETPAPTPAEKLTLLAPDFRKPGHFPRSPRELFAGYVIAARCIDKIRADLAGTIGEYHSGCPLDKFFLEFTGLSYESLREYVATGATDAELTEWITKNAKARPRSEIIRWNNEWRGRRLSELPDNLQEYMEDYVPKFVPRNRPVYVFFDIYDLEEQRI